MTTYEVGNPGRGLEIGTHLWLGLTTCMYFFFLYYIVQYQISHTFKQDCCHHLRLSDVSYFTISLRNH
jgi:hypothetical protein